MMIGRMLGITRKDQLFKLPEEKKGIPIAIPLLSTFADDIAEDDEKKLHWIYRQITLNDTPSRNKQTYARRHEWIDDVIVETLRRIFQPGQRLRIHEMAASNGITSLELFEKLSDFNKTFRVTDFYDAVYVVNIAASNWKVVFDAQHHPLQIIGKHIVIPLRIAKKDNIFLKIMRFTLSRFLLQKAERVLESLNKDPRQVQRIELWHPRCKTMAHCNPDFILGRDDFYRPAPGAFELIRIMDAFHHLPQDEVSKILRSVLPNVVEGGLFVLGDKLPKKEAVGIIFQRQGGKFVPIIEIGKIAPYMRIVDDIKLPI